VWQCVDKKKKDSAHKLFTLMYNGDLTLQTQFLTNTELKKTHTAQLLPELRLWQCDQKFIGTNGVILWLHVMQLGSRLTAFAYLLINLLSS
jgi:hypothetical protein